MKKFIAIINGWHKFIYYSDGAYITHGAAMRLNGGRV
jgi:hypothetical protein